MAALSARTLAWLLLSCGATSRALHGERRGLYGRDLAGKGEHRFAHDPTSGVRQRSAHDGRAFRDAASSERDRTASAKDRWRCVTNGRAARAPHTRDPHTPAAARAASGTASAAAAHAAGTGGARARRARATSGVTDASACCSATSSTTTTATGLADAAAGSCQLRYVAPRSRSARRTVPLARGAAATCSGDRCQRGESRDHRGAS
jgi:hypothetical protein